MVRQVVATQERSADGAFKGANLYHVTAPPEGIKFVKILILSWCTFYIPFTIAFLTSTEQYWLAISLFLQLLLFEVEVFAN